MGLLFFCELLAPRRPAEAAGISLRDGCSGRVRMGSGAGLLLYYRSPPPRAGGISSPDGQIAATAAATHLLQIFSSSSPAPRGDLGYTVVKPPSSFGPAVEQSNALISPPPPVRRRRWQKTHNPWTKRRREVVALPGI